MSGQIFISYRREDAAPWAGRLSDHLSAQFPESQIFMDVDNLGPGADFVEAIETGVGSCDVLIAVIGKGWLISSDEKGRRRLDNADDWVRLEIGTALKRNILVIPVLVDGASMPLRSQLPGDIELFARKNAVEIRHDRFRIDSGLIIQAIKGVFEKAEAEQRQPEEKERLEAEQREKQRLEAEQQERERLEAEKERLEAEQREQERLQAEQREKERLEAEQREKELLEGERVQKERSEAEQRAKERLAAEQRQREEAEERERAEKERLEAEQPQCDEKKERFWSLNSFYRTFTRKFATQSWIRKIDKLSWLPFSLVAVVSVWHFVWLFHSFPDAFQLGGQEEPWKLWLDILALMALPCLITVSSFLTYTNRRTMEVACSMLSFAAVLVQAIDFWVTIGRFYIPSFLLVRILLVALGATLKLWLLIGSQRSRAGAIATASGER